MLSIFRQKTVIWVAAWRGLIDFLEAALTVVWATRATLIIVLLTFLVCRTGQFVDVLRVIAERGVSQPGFAVAFILSFLLLLWNTWYWTPLSFLVPESPPVSSSYEQGRRNMGAIYAILLCCTIASSLFTVNIAEAGDDARPFNLAAPQQLSLFFWLLPLTGVIGFRRLARLAPRAYGPKQKWLSGGLGALWLLLSITMLWQNQWAAIFGPFAVVTFTLALWVPLLSTLTRLESRYRSPLSIAILMWALLLSARGWSDSTQVQLKPHSRKRNPPVLAQSFTAWLNARPDKGLYKTGEGYPVFIVAIEGGGMRSAYMGAMLLSRIQDHEPRFAHHVFAISGVSGGSVGASVFAALCEKYVKAQPKDVPPMPWKKVGPLEKLSDAILSQDLLSPVLASALYSNALQQVVPWPLPHSDPGQALELGLESAWKKATDTDFPPSFYDLSDPDHFSRKSIPALFLNTTDADSGERMVLINLYLLEPNQGRFSALADRDSQPDLKLSTAAVWGARFPGVTPSAYLRSGYSTRKQRFVDGGYFENSGCATALDIFNALQYGQVIEDRPRFYPVVIRIGYQPSDSPRRSTKGWEQLTPIKTLINSRDGRGTTAIQQLKVATTDTLDRDFAFNDQNPKQAVERNENRMIEFVFKRQVTQTAMESGEKKTEVPLGWLLSETSRLNMKSQLKAPLENNCYYSGDTSVALDQVVRALHPLSDNYKSTR